LDHVASLGASLRRCEEHRQNGSRGYEPHRPLS
jgi:hypothetical protein